MLYQQHLPLKRAGANHAAIIELNAIAIDMAPIIIGAAVPPFTADIWFESSCFMICVLSDKYLNKRCYPDKIRIYDNGKLLNDLYEII
jgi:hypothetical protein